MTDLLTTLRTSVMPQVFTALGDNGVVEKMTIVRKVFTPDGAGGETQTGTTNAYSNIPVKVVIDKKGGRVDAQGKLIAKQTYMLTFPPYFSGAQITIDLATDYFITDAHGSEPAKTYRIEAAGQGVLNEYVCTIEG